LKNANYNRITSQDIKAGDVVTWENSDGIIQHASFCIGDHLFFNKNGQTFFNAWKIVDLTELNENWDDYHMQVFRKTA
jgi:cell wall-associated NlpC family hydrolase